MRESDLTNKVKGIVNQNYAYFTITFNGSWKGTDDVVISRVNRTTVWFGSITEPKMLWNGKEVPKIRGTLKMEEFLTYLESEDADLIRAAIAEDWQEELEYQIAKKEAEDLEKAERQALRCLKAAEKMFEAPKPKAPVIPKPKATKKKADPAPKVSEPRIFGKWKIEDGKAWSPNGRPWNITTEDDNFVYLESRKSDRTGRLHKANGHYEAIISR